MTRYMLSAAAAATIGLIVQAPANAAVKAADNAADAAYAAEVDGAWKGENPGADENPPGTDNGGTGFLPWSFAGGYNPVPEDPLPPNAYGTLNHFIDGVDFPTTAFNDLGGPAFGLANATPGFSAPSTTATRPFAEPMNVGEIFSADIDTPALYDDYTLFNFPFAIIAFSDAGGAQTFSVEAGSSSQFGDFPWRYKDGVHVTEFGDFGVDAGGASIAPTATSDGSTIRLEVLTSTTARVTLDGVPLDITLAAGLPASVAFTLFDNNSVATLVGDFDASTAIDGADLAKWQSEYGPNPGSDADGDGDSDGNDFLLWQRNLGATTGAPTGEHAFYFDNLKIETPTATAGVPEPGSIGLLLAATALLAAGRQRRGSRG